MSVELDAQVIQLSSKNAALIFTLPSGQKFEALSSNGRRLELLMVKRAISAKQQNLLVVVGEPEEHAIDLGGLSVEVGEKAAGASLVRPLTHARWRWGVASRAAFAAIAGNPQIAASPSAAAQLVRYLSTVSRQSAAAWGACPIFGGTGIVIDATGGVSAGSYRAVVNHHGQLQVTDCCIRIGTRSPQTFLFLPLECAQVFIEVDDELIEIERPAEEPMGDWPQDAVQGLLAAAAESKEAVAGADSPLPAVLAVPPECHLRAPGGASIRIDGWINVAGYVMVFARFEEPGDTSTLTFHRIGSTPLRSENLRARYLIATEACEPPVEVLIYDDASRARVLGAVSGADTPAWIRASSHLSHRLQHMLAPLLMSAAGSADDPLATVKRAVGDLAAGNGSMSYTRYPFGGERPRDVEIDVNIFDERCDRTDIDRSLSSLLIRSDAIRLRGAIRIFCRFATQRYLSIAERWSELAATPIAVVSINDGTNLNKILRHELRKGAGISVFLPSGAVLFGDLEGAGTRCVHHVWQQRVVAVAVNAANREALVASLIELNGFADVVSESGRFEGCRQIDSDRFIEYRAGACGAPGGMRIGRIIELPR